MYWEKLEGMFTFQILYSNMIKKFETGSKFVEIGVWKGKSAVYMAEKIKESGKNIKFYAVDLFTGEQEGYRDDIDVKNNTLLEKYMKNIEPVKKFITTIQANSQKAFKQFDNQSLDFLFIDGDHTYKGVRADLENWFPKVKKEGIIAGHDYNEPSCGVKKAVDEFFASAAEPYQGGCWYFKK